MLLSRERKESSTSAETKLQRHFGHLVLFLELHERKVCLRLFLVHFLLILGWASQWHARSAPGPEKSVTVSAHFAYSARCWHSFLSDCALCPVMSVCL